MYRVLLVNPPRHHLVHLDTPDNVDLGEMSSFPPIGLMYLAEALRRGMEGVEVRIVDAVVDDLDAEAVVARVRDFATDMVGMTTFTYTFYDAWTTARAIKRAFPEMPVAVGGPHMYLFPTETLRHDCFDYGVVGDGETAFPALCEALRRGKEFPEDVPGLVAWRRDGLIGQPAPAEISDPDEIGVPAIDLIDVRRYFSPIGKSDAVGTICTSRGCPFRCTFCQVPHRRYRMRSVGSVVDEIEQYVSRDVRDFFFFDDLFNITTTRVIDFCDELDRRGLRVSWMFRGRADQVSDEMARRARAAGCHTISLGVEAATDAGLREIRKKLTMEQAFRAVRTIRKAGIACSTNWIVGLPHQQTRADLEHLLKTAIRMDATHAQFSVLQCMPGSELYEQAVTEGGIDAGAWPGYVRNPVAEFHPPIWEKHFTKKELFDFYQEAFRRYYLRPRVIWRELLATRSWDQLCLKARSFLNVFVR